MTISITFSHDDEDVLARWNGVGRPMTAQEINLDLYNIKFSVDALQAGYTATISIATITQPSPSTMRVTKTDATFYDIDLPSATFVDRGEWAADTFYVVNDTLTANGSLYRVPFDHTSADTFDPNANDGMGHDYYAAMLSSPANALPAGGSVRMSLKKSSGTDYAVTWGFDIASDVIFTPSIASSLSSDNVADALEELETLITDVVVDAVNVTFSAPTGSELVSTNVADALVELETLIDAVTVDAVDVTFTAPTGSTLASTNVADALVELEGMTGGGGSGDMLAANNLSDLTNATTARSNLGVAIGSQVQAYDADLAALAAVSSNGLLAHTGPGTAAARTLTAGTYTSVSNGDGASGNPTVDVLTATAAQYRDNTANKVLTTDKVWSAADTVALTDAATIAVDMSTFINGSVTLAGNRTLGNPSNTKNNQCGVIKIVQDGTGSRTLAYASNWKFAGGTAPTLTTTAAAVDLLFYQVVSSTFIYATLVADVK